MNPMSINILPQAQIEQYAKTLGRNDRPFSEDENKCKSQRKAAQSKADNLKRQIKALGKKEDPGIQPDYEPFVKPLCRTVGWIWGISVLLMFLFHCVIWVGKLLFDISWDTWGWTKTCFMYGLYIEIACFLGGSIVYGFAYWFWNYRKKAYIEWKTKLQLLKSELSSANSNIKELDQSLANIDVNRQNILAYAYKLRLSLPIRCIQVQNLEKAQKTLFEFLDKKEAIDSISDPMKKFESLLDFYDRKLKLFYNVSVPSEATSQEALNTVTSAVCRLENSRGELLLSETKVSHVESLSKNNSRYNSSSLDARIDEFNDVLEMDTSGFLTKHNSAALEKQVAGLSTTFDTSLAFYKGHEKVVQKINYALSVVRLVAYRNIYLGAELLNVVREGAGGGKLTTAFDSISCSLQLANSKSKIETFSTSAAISNMLTTGFDSITTSVNNILSDKKARNYAANNPKQAALAVAGAAAFSIIESGIQAWKKRNAKIEGLIKQEEKLIKNMEALVDSYLMNLSSSKRALELIKAIIKANDGFTAIYAPLSNKVFVDKSIDSVSMTELQELAIAISEYKKISDSKL